MTRQPLPAPGRKPPPPPPPAPAENEPTSAPLRPRGPFCVYQISMFRMPKCQLCGAKATTKRPGRHSRFPELTDICAVGPFKICNECVAELDRVLLDREE